MCLFINNNIEFVLNLNSFFIKSNTDYQGRQENYINHHQRKTTKKGRSKYKKSDRVHNRNYESEENEEIRRKFSRKNTNYENDQSENSRIENGFNIDKNLKRYVSPNSRIFRKREEGKRINIDNIDINNTVKNINRNEMYNNLDIGLENQHVNENAFSSDTYRLEKDNENDIEIISMEDSTYSENLGRKNNISDPKALFISLEDKDEVETNEEKLQKIEKLRNKFEKRYKENLEKRKKDKEIRQMKIRERALNELFRENKKDNERRERKKSLKEMREENRRNNPKDRFKNHSYDSFYQRRRIKKSASYSDISNLKKEEKQKISKSHRERRHSYAGQKNTSKIPILKHEFWLNQQKDREDISQFLDDSKIQISKSNEFESKNNSNSKVISNSHQHCHHKSAKNNKQQKSNHFKLNRSSSVDNLNSTKLLSKVKKEKLHKIRRQRSFDEIYDCRIPGSDIIKDFKRSAKHKNQKNSIKFDTTNKNDSNIVKLNIKNDKVQNKGVENKTYTKKQRDYLRQMHKEQQLMIKTRIRNGRWNLREMCINI